MELIDFRFVLHLLFVGYLTSISISWSNTASVDRMNHELEMEGQDRGLVEMLSGYLPEHNEDNHKEFQLGWRCRS